jgi:hypothetical protein
MHKIILRPKVREKVRTYIDAYETYNENLYTDSGLGIAEDIIIEQYRESAAAISGAIYDAIETALSRETILGYSEKDDQSREITTRIENRRIFLSYIESDISRVVTDIRIVYL